MATHQPFVSTRFTFAVRCAGVNRNSFPMCRPKPNENSRKGNGRRCLRHGGWKRSSHRLPPTAQPPQKFKSARACARSRTAHRPTPQPERHVKELPKAPSARAERSTTCSRTQTERPGKNGRRLKTGGSQPHSQHGLAATTSPSQSIQDSVRAGRSPVPARSVAAVSNYRRRKWAWAEEAAEQRRRQEMLRILKGGI